MHRDDRPRRTLRRLATLAAALTIGCGPASPPPEPEASEPEPSPGIVKYDKDGLRYTYHVPTASEGLFDLEADPRCLKNLASERPDDVARLRRDLEAELEVESLDELREEFSEHIERLRDLGYL